MRRRINTVRRCFTLVELLVVVLIIGLLISLLLPVLWRAYRRAMVLNCPITYIADDGSLRLTDPSGKIDLELVGEKDGELYRLGRLSTTHPMWSPDGLKIAVRLQQPKYIAVIDPATGKWKTLAGDSSVGFAGWADAGHVMTLDGGDMKRVNLLDADNGTLWRSVRLPFEHSFGYGAMASVPLLCSRGRYVSMSSRGSNGIGTGIALLRKDFTLARAVWEEPPNGNQQHWHPRVDPFGENIAWTTALGDGSGRYIIALKRVEDGPSVQPQQLGDQFASAVFCDWTEDGKLLANVAKTAGSGGSFRDWTLVILTPRGALVRELATPVPPKAEGMAAWRKYEHR